MKKTRKLISAQDYERALEDGRKAMEQPHALRASYNARRHTLTVVYSNSFTCSFDVREAPQLKESPDADFSDPCVTPGGDGLIFEKSNMAVSLSMIVAKFIPADIGKYWSASQQGRRTSVVKAATARANGARGGRPRKEAKEPQFAHA